MRSITTFKMLPFYLVITVLLCLTVLHTTAQSRDAFVQFNEKSVPAFFIEIPAGKDLCREILEKRLLTGSGKIKVSKEAFLKLSKIQHPQFSRDFLDIYFKLVETNVNDRRTTQLYFLVSKGYDNFINTSSDAVISENVKQFLNQFLTDVQRINFNEEIRKQEVLLEAIQKTTISIQASINALEQEKISLEQKILKSEKDLANQKIIEEQAAEQLAKLKLLMESFDVKLKKK